jgi:hypothetical protein
MIGGLLKALLILKVVGSFLTIGWFLKHIHGDWCRSDNWRLEDLRVHLVKLIVHFHALELEDGDDELALHGY